MIQTPKMIAWARVAYRGSKVAGEYVPVAKRPRIVDYPEGFRKPVFRVGRGHIRLYLKKPQSFGCVSMVSQCGVNGTMGIATVEVSQCGVNGTMGIATVEYTNVNDRGKTFSQLEIRTYDPTGRPVDSDFFVCVNG